MRSSVAMRDLVLCALFNLNKNQVELLLRAVFLLIVRLCRILAVSSSACMCLH